MYPEMIPVYAPATFRRKNAKVFEIRGDERIVDADLTIDPNGLIPSGAGCSPQTITMRRRR
jgi:hypothetical protein